MKKHHKDIAIGLVSGLIANVLGIFLYIAIFSKYSLKTTLQITCEQGNLGSLIALGAILNLLVFFGFLRLRKDNRAKGVLFASILLALVILFLQFK